MTVVRQRVRQMGERFYSRVTGEVPVTLQVGEQRVQGTGTTLNPDGMSVVTVSPLPDGAPITLALEHGGQPWKVEVEATVRDGAYLGLKFVAPSAEFKDIVGSIIEALRDVGSPTDDHVNVPVVWMAPKPQSSGWLRSRARRHQGKLFSLSERGAAMVSAEVPEVGAEIVLILGQTEDSPSCSVTVVRHTARGFAVQFQSLPAEFCAAVNRLRRVTK